MPVVLMAFLVLTGTVLNVQAASVTDMTPTVAASTNSNWTSANNALSQNGNTADWKNTDQSYLVLTGFDFSAIPAGAHIDGITVTVRGSHSSGTASYRQYQVGLTKNGSSVAGSLDTAGEFTQSLANYTHGGATNLWGTSWTDADLKRANFGVMLTDNNGTQTSSNPGYSIDVMYITVDYTVTCVPSGSLAIVAGQTLNGNPIDLSSVATIDTATNLVYQVSDNNGPGTAINVGPAFSTTALGTGYSGETDIDNSVAANATGTLTQVKVYFTAATTGDQIKFFTASISGSTVTPRSVTPVMTIPAPGGAKAYTFTVSLPIAAGDYVGLYSATASVDQGGAGLVYKNGDNIAIGTPYTGTADNAYGLNIHASGTTGNGSQILFNGSAAQAVNVDTASWVGGVKNLDITGEDLNCTGSVLAPAAGTFTWNTCNDANVATLTTTASSPASGVVTVQTAVGGGQTANVMQSMKVTIGGAGTCSVTDAAMSWNATTSRWEYSWDTSSCGTTSVVNGVSIDVSGNDPDCGTAVAAAQVSGVSIDNTCTDNSASVSLDVISAPITGLISVSATSNRANLVEVSLDGSTWAPSGSLNYNPPIQSTGIQNFYARTTNNCGTRIFDTNNPTSVAYETRTTSMVVEPVQVSQASLTAIAVSMPYKGDYPANGRFTVAWKLTSDPDSAGSWTTVANNVLDGDGISPFNVTISALTTGQFYDVRVTYADTDGLSGVSAVQDKKNIEMVPWTDSPLLHNSNRFSCSKPGYFANSAACVSAGGTWSAPKHNASGGWGRPSTYAGGISCATCHAKETGNVKRVKTSISFPDGAGMPGGGFSASVSLQTVEDGSSDFGDDSATRSSSNRVCEACHKYEASQLNGVKQHAANQAVTTTHYNNADCVKCHQHNAGFRADCTTCHTNPPLGAGQLTKDLDPSESTGSTTWGKHQLHAVDKGYSCNTCHNGWEGSGQMPKAGNINLGFNIVLGSTTDTTGTYDGRNNNYTTSTGTTNSAGGALTCSAVYCHGTSTPQWSDTAGSMVCGSCHGDTSGAPIETMGDGDLSGATTGPKVGKHVKHVAKYACSVCHNGAGDGSVTGKHVNGNVEVVFDSAVAGSATFTPDPINGGTCSNLACHSNQIWNTGTPALACNSCHGYPPTSAKDAANNRHASGATAVNHDQKNTTGSTSAITSNHADCQTCHGKNSAGLVDNTGAGGDAYVAGYHIDGKIQMNGISAPNNNQSAEYVASGTGAYGCAKACHANNSAHQLSDSGLPVQMLELGGGDCNGCHETGSNGAPRVTSAGSHSETVTGFTCVGCHGAHNAGTIEVPNNSTVGINYSANGESGIALGGAATSGNTEAEICWNCHSNGSTDWRNGGDYNGYTITNRNWTAASFNAPGSAIPTRSVASIHSVNSLKKNSSVANNVNGSGQISITSLEPAGDIRCSYCHDVHDLNRTAGDASTGKPYLRGSWLSNPYPLERPPQSGDSYSGNNWGQGKNFPRLYANSAGSSSVGGFFIDQNSGKPMNGKTLAGTAGLCTLCHGSNVDSMDYYSGSKLWRPSQTNGHSNSTIGGSGTSGVNIFDARHGTTTVGNMYMAAQDGVNKYRYGKSGNEPKKNGPFSNRYNGNKPAKNSGSNAPPKNTGWYGGTPGSTTRGGQYSTWYGSSGVGNNGIGSRAHDFSCSKCHSPHASGLPALLITNCLDISIATWSTTGNSNNYGSVTIGPKATNAYAKRVQNNCHRKEGTRNSGWNYLAPGQ